MHTDTHSIPSADGLLYAQRWQPDGATGAPLLLLHDSLGCVALWRDFPAQLAAHTGRPVIAYDRPGFGRSAPQAAPLPLTFITDEACRAFAAVRHYFQIGTFAVLGHSVGGGMAIGCAAAYPDACEAVITESAQAFVEAQTLEGIREAQRQFAQPGQHERLARYHGERASWVLRAWIDNWLSPAFRTWNMDTELTKVRCPVLCLHGDQDEYGSVAHPERISSGLPRAATVRLLAGCGHVPHRERPDQVLGAISRFLTNH